MKTPIRKTATVTWIYYRNCGTYLQAYALQHVLRSFGLENAIIDDKRFVYRFRWREWLGKCRAWLMGRRRDQPCYRRFRRRYLKVDRSYRHPAGLNERYDVFLCGSDQIWSPYVPFCGFYYLDFAEKPKIAYAPSVGTSQRTAEYVHRVIPLISRFSALSVREEPGRELLSGLTDKPVRVVLDPTFLPPMPVWDEVAEHSCVGPIRQPYAFAYFLTPNVWYMEAAARSARAEGLPLVVFATRQLHGGYGDRIVYGGPCEFVSLIKGAARVFTDSYHATIFSLRYELKFTTFKRFDDGAWNDQNARLADLFRLLGHPDAFLGKAQAGQVVHPAVTDYTLVRDRLAALRADSLAYLREALSISC